MEIRNDVTRKPEAKLAEKRCGGGEAKRREEKELLDTHRRNFYLQIAALVLEILQPLVVQFLAVSHVSASLRVECNQTGR